MAAAALAAVDPERLVREELARRSLRFDAIVAVGKASAAMARGAGEASRCLLIRPHTSPALSAPGWEELTGGHPFPDRGSVAAGKRLASWLEAIGPDVTLLALAAARELADGEVVLALATDGEDGATGTAGAVVDGGSWEAILRAGIDPGEALSRHDSLAALEKVPGALLRTGVTGTNVGDLALYLRRLPAVGNGMG